MSVLDMFLGALGIVVLITVLGFMFAAIADAPDPFDSGWEGVCNCDRCKEG